MIDNSFSPSRRILLTGFGPFLNIKTNPSSTILARLPSKLSHRGTAIDIIAHPSPLPAGYHQLATIGPQLISEHNPDAVIHIGLAADRNYFAIERGANRDGYTEFPDMARKVVTKVEGAKWWGEAPERLDSEWEWEDLGRRWREIAAEEEAVGGKGKGKKGGGGAGKGGLGELPDVRLSDDVGSYVCGLLYYASLEAMRRQEGREGKVLFFHVPPLENEVDLKRGDQALIALIKAVAEQLGEAW